MKLNSLLAGVALLALTTGANAADLLYSTPAPAYKASYAPYVAVRAGVISPEDADANFGTSPNGVTGGFDPGYVFSGALGIAGNQWGIFAPRFEALIEASGAGLKSGQFFNATGPVGAPFTLDGSQKALAAYGGLLIDLPLTGWGITPFVGAYLGMADVDVVANVGGFSAINDSDTVLAWKLTAGLSYDLYRDVKLEASYDYTTFADVNVQGIGGLNTSDDLTSHTFKLGARIGL